MALSLIIVTATILVLAFSATTLPFAEAALLAFDEEACARWGTSGTMSIGRRTISITDTNRDNRVLTVDIWYPAVNNGEALTPYSPLLPSEGKYVALDNPTVASPPVSNNGTTSSSSFPLLIFSHGYNGIRQQSAKLMEHLASWGFVVASPDHAGNSQNDPAGITIPFTVFDRPKDVSFVIDTMLSLPHVEEFHLQDSAVDQGGRVGVLGHSYGGLTSLLVAPDGPWSDDRVKAIMPIAPAVDFERDDFLSKINVPMLVIGGVNDTVTPVDPNNVKAFRETNGLPKWNLVVNDAGHNSFADLCWIYDTLVSLLKDEDTVHSLMGGGSIEQGKYLMAGSLCETFEVTQTILGYYAVAFFYTVLSLRDSDHDNKESIIAKKCMAEQATMFHLATFEFSDNSDVSGAEPVQSQTPEPIPNISEGETKEMSTSSSAAFSIKVTEVVQLLASCLIVCVAVVL